MKKELRWIATALMASLLAAGCSIGSTKEAPPTVDPIPVAVTVAAEGRLTAIHTASGQIEPVLAVPITSKVPGRVTAVHREMGDQVAKGDLVVELESRDAAAQLAQARANLAQAEAQRDEVDRQHTRLADLLRAGAVSQQQADQAQTQLALAYAQVEAARASVDLATANLEHTRVTAPAAGVLAARSVEVGAMIGSGSTLFQLVDLRQVVMNTGVAERDVNAVHPGTTVAVSVPALNQEFAGRVEAVSPNMDRQTRSFRVRITLENPLGVLKGGMFAQVRLPVAEQTGILLPVDSVIERNGGFLVYIVEAGHAREQQVTVLISASDRVAVSGVAPGAAVVTAGQSRLVDGSPVAVGGSGTP